MIQPVRAQDSMRQHASGAARQTKDLRMHVPLRQRLIALCITLLLPAGAAHADFTAQGADARMLAKQVYLYGFPVVEFYKTLYSEALDEQNPNFKAPLNQIGNTARLHTPRDNSLSTPNLDTAPSFAWMDLRAEPLVLTLPPIEDSRYYSVQLIDLYTHNFAYLGTRTTGNQGGVFLIAGPYWQGEVPSSVDQVIRSESNLVYALYRTQLLGETDLLRVRQIQQGYTLRPLSNYLGNSVIPNVPAVDWPEPSVDTSDSPSLFRFLNFMLGFAAQHPSEAQLMSDFSRIGVGRGLTFNESRLSASQLKSLQTGIANAKAEFAALQMADDNAGLPSGSYYGNREQLQNDYLRRYAGARLGLFSDSPQELSYRGYLRDSQGQPLNAGPRTYTLRFAPGQLPPTHAFWSLTLYDARTRGLVENPLGRYQISARQLDRLQMDADGGLTLYLQNQSPGVAKESNWLPTPNGAFYGLLRLYLPQDPVIDGTWQAPALLAEEKRLTP